LTALHYFSLHRNLANPDSAEIQFNSLERVAWCISTNGGSTERKWK